MTNPLFINGVQYAPDLAMARVSHNGNARLTQNGATLPFGTKLYYREEPSLAQLTELVRALVAKGAEPEFLKSLVAFAVGGIQIDLNAAVADTSVDADGHP
jgi:hypothetical protein